MTTFYVRAAAAALLWFFVSASTIAELATLRPAMSFSQKKAVRG